MGNFFLCRALVLLTENLYWAISILNDDFGTKCWKVVIFLRTHLSQFVTVGLPVSQVPASVPVLSTRTDVLVLIRFIRAQYLYL